MHFNSKTEQDTSQNASSSTKESPTSGATLCLPQHSSDVFLSTAVIHAYDSKDKVHSCRVLLDNGSQLNFVTEDFAKILHLNKQSMNMPISDIGQGSVEAKNFVNITVQSRFNAY